MDFMGFKKKFFRYLINHYLGQFLEQKCSLDQLTVDLYNGTGHVKDVQLDCQALNQVAEEQGIPVEFLELTLGTVEVNVPWTKLLTDSCQINVKGLYVAVQPKNRVDNGSSMINSMFTSMASSMHLAEDFLRTQIETDEEIARQSEKEKMSGLEAIAKAIEAVLCRIKVDFKDTIIRVERACRPGSNSGIALELHINSFLFSDESLSTKNAPDDSRQVFDTAFQVKKLLLQGIKIYSDIYKITSPFGDPLSSSNDDNQMDNLILIANLTGLGEIELRIKTDESMGGPQIALDCSFGAMVALLTPVQAHIIQLILQDFLEPVPSPTQEGKGYRQHVKEKPMDSFDFMRIKEELEETNRKETIGLPGIHPGWSAAFDEEPEERFLPFKTKSGLFSSVHDNLMETSMFSDTGSVNQSMTESGMSLGVRSGISSLASPYKSSGGPSHLGMNMIASQSEKTKFAVSIASAAVILLHEDILALSKAMTVVPSTAKELHKFSKDFFDQVKFVTTSGKKQIDDMKQLLQRACPKSCLRLIASPVKVEGSTAVDNSLPVTSGHVSFAFFELVESLKDNEIPGSPPSSILTEVLQFPQCNSVKESLKIEFKHKLIRARNAMSKTDIRVYLQECVSEFDMSIFDRLNSLLQPKLPVILDGHQLDNITSLNKPHSAMFFKITSPKCSVDFRFPIPDMRKSDDQNKVPYWTRNVRSDSIIFSLKDLTFNTSVNSQSDIFKFETQCQEVHLFYKANPTDSPMHFATASANDINNTHEFDMEGPSLQGFDRPRVVVTIYPERNVEVASANTSRSDADDPATHLEIAHSKSGPSPFCSRTVIRECLSLNPEEKDDDENFGESVIPGDQEEMKQFMDDTNRNVLYEVDCNFRSVNVKMPSKEFFEELYNRLSMDLLLWEPLAPKQTYPGESDGSSSFRGCLGPNQFSMGKSGIPLDSDSETDDEESKYFSTAEKIGVRERRRSKSSKRQEKNKRILPLGQSEVTISLAISHGVCAFFTPFEDTLGNIVPELKGQVTLEIEKGNLFIVSGYKGNRNLGFLCLHSHRATFLHAEHVKSTDLIPRTDPLLIRTIYPTEEGVGNTWAPPDGASVGNQRVDMLAVSIQIDKDELKNVKKFKVAVGIKDGTIDYRMSFPNRNWFTQIVDFFDVTDVCVEGYTPSTVLTELYVHLWNCAASYTPIPLPLRLILTVESLSISVNIATQNDAKVVRFIADDSALFLTNKKESNDLRHDYVCVMDMSLFELVMRIGIPTSTGFTKQGQPRFELRASNDVLNVRTCSDSIKHLIEIITHLGNNGDLPAKDFLSEMDEFREGGGIVGMASQNPFAGSSSSVFMDSEESGSEYTRQYQQPSASSSVGTAPFSAAPQRDRRYSQNQNAYQNPNQNQAAQNQNIHSEHLHNMVAEAMQENLNYSSQPHGRGNEGNLKRFGSVGSGLGRSPKSRSDSGGNSGPGVGSGSGSGFGSKQSIEIHFDPGQRLYPNLLDQDEGQVQGLGDLEDDMDDFNGNAGGKEGSNVSTPAPQLFRRDDPIMESCDGLPVSIQMSDEDEEDFCVLGEDPGVGIMPRDGEPEIRILTKLPIELIENHFTVPMNKVDILQAPKRYPKAVTKFTVNEVSIVWQVYGGEDFGTSGLTRNSTKANFGGSSETLSHDAFLYDSSDPSQIDLGIDPLNQGPVSYSANKAFQSEFNDSPKMQRRYSVANSWRTQGGKGRIQDVGVQLKLEKVKFRHEVYPNNTEQASRQILVIKTVEIKDKMSASGYNKMLHLYTSANLPMQSCANMVVIKAAHIRPDPHLTIEECSLKVSLQPIRLNIDQDTVIFLHKFFTHVADSKSEDEDDLASASARPPSHTPSCESLPVMMVNTKDGVLDDPLQGFRDRDAVYQGQGQGLGNINPPSSFEDDSSQNLIMFADCPTPSNSVPTSSQFRGQEDNVSVCSKDPSVDSLKPSVPIYFREVIFSPEVPMRIDYHGKHKYDMTNGPVAGIFMALGQLDSAEIKLIQLTNNRGILGVGKVLGYFGTEWVNDIRTNQIPNVLGGVDIFIPMHSFVQLFQGVKNLFVLPVEQYQKDGRLAKGLQRGVNSFSTSAAMAFLKLSNRIVQVFQGAAEFTYDMVSPGPSVQQQRRHSSTRKKRYSQPSDMREGVTNAYNVVREGLGDTAQTIVRVVSKENEQKGVSGAVGGVLRQIPPALIVKPMILVAEATSNVLEGLKSQLEPETKKEAAEKWKNGSYD